MGAIRWILVAISLLAAADARAEPCSREQAKAAVEAAMERVARLGVAAAKALIDSKEAELTCGGYSVKVMDYGGTWLIDPDGPVNVGRNVTFYNDGAATNFMRGLIKAARDSQGGLLSYFTTDSGPGGVKVDKALYYVDLPSRSVVLYGAFIITP